MSDDLSARLERLSPAQRAVLENMLGTAARPQAPAEPTPPRNPVEENLVTVWQQVLRTDRIGVHDSFYALGGDSIASLQISARAAAAGLRVTSQQVLAEETIARLAAVAGRTEPAADGADADTATGDVPLTPIQHWFFEQELPNSHHWDQAVLTEVLQDLDGAVVRDALRAVVHHHDGLRSTFHCHDGGWTQTAGAAGTDFCYREVDLTDLDAPDQDRRVAAAVTDAQQVVNLQTGPLVSAVLFRLHPARHDRLLLAVHHLVVDGVSIPVLMDDMARACSGPAAGSPPQLPPRTASFRRWSQALVRHANGPRISGQLDYWREVPRPGATAASLGSFDSGEDASNTQGRARKITTEVALETAAMLRANATAASGVHARHILLAALMLAWQQTTGRPELQLDLEGHGREPLDDLDVTRTVGWFTSIFPVVLRLPGGGGGRRIAQAVRRQLDEVPDNGIGYGLLRYLNPAGRSALTAAAPSLVSFNYLGWFNRPGDASLFGPPLQVPSPLQSDEAPRRYLIDIAVTGVEDRLLVEWVYGGDFYQEADVARLADAYLRTLDEMVTACSAQAGVALARQIVVNER